MNYLFIHHMIMEFIEFSVSVYSSHTHVIHKEWTFSQGS